LILAQLRYVRVLPALPVLGVDQDGPAWRALVQDLMADVGAGLALLDTVDLVAAEFVPETVVDVGLSSVSELVCRLLLCLAREPSDLLLELFALAMVLNLDLKELGIAVLFKGRSLLLQFPLLRGLKLLDLRGGSVAFGDQRGQLLVGLGLETGLGLRRCLLRMTATLASISLILAVALSRAAAMAATFSSASSLTRASRFCISARSACSMRAPSSDSFFFCCSAILLSISMNFDLEMVDPHHGHGSVAACG
jgi:hypothetical protein